MPFTFSHPSIVLPLAFLPNRIVSLSALIIGSITPDFEYFIRMQLKSEHSHSFFGLFWWDVPIGVVLFFLFHCLVKRPLVQNLPLFLSERFEYLEVRRGKPAFGKQWWIVLICLWLGAASHVLWDGFTHKHGFFVEYFTFLSSDIFGIQVYKVLQHVSTFLGGITLVLSIHQLPRKRMECHQPKVIYWLVILVVTVLLLGFRFFCGGSLNRIGNFVVSFISSGILGVVVASLICTKSQMK